MSANRLSTSVSEGQDLSSSNAAGISPSPVCKPADGEGAGAPSAVYYAANLELNMQTVKLVLLTTLIVGYGVALQAGVMPDELSQITLPSITEPSIPVIESGAPVALKGLWQGLMEFVMLATLIIL